MKTKGYPLSYCTENINGCQWKCSYLFILERIGVMTRNFIRSETNAPYKSSHTDSNIKQRLHAGRFSTVGQYKH